MIEFSGHYKFTENLLHGHSDILRLTITYFFFEGESRPAGAAAKVNLAAGLAV
jgi:hypothetical protein